MFPYNDNGGQHIFDRILQGFIFLLKLCFWLLVNSPFLWTGWLLARIFLTRKNEGLLWLVMILVFALVAKKFFELLQILAFHWKSKNNRVWLPVFLFYLFFTCVLPAILVIHLLERFFLAMQMPPRVNLILSFTIGFIFGIFLFQKRWSIYQ